MIDKNELKQIIEAIYPSVVRIRRKIHANPELSGEERETAAFIARELKKAGIRPRFYLGKTAVVARIRNGRGKSVALRADTDALPLQEQTGLSFASKKPGAMHACGHDMHAAILLGAAAVLDRLRPAWRGSVVLLFQPSEEMEPGGAAGLIGAGAFPENPAGVFGLHVNPGHATGSIGLRPGNDFAGVLNFTITVIGRGGHAAAPDSTVNPIPCAAQMVLELTRLTSLNFRGSKKPAVVAVGTINAGERSNIIPDTIEFKGTIRTHGRRREQEIRRQAERIVRSAARRHGAHAQIVFFNSYPANFNDPDLTGRMAAAYKRLLGRRRVAARKEPIFYAEDFSYYQQKTAGLFAHLGVRPSGGKNPAGVHSARFSPDEQAMKTGILAHVAFVLELLGGKDERTKMKNTNARKTKTRNTKPRVGVWA